MPEQLKNIMRVLDYVLESERDHYITWREDKCCDQEEHIYEMALKAQDAVRAIDKMYRMLHADE